MEAEQPQTDQRLFLAFVVIDMTCGFVLVLRMCCSLCKIAGFVCAQTATTQMTIEDRFIASGHTTVSQRAQCFLDGIKIQ